MKISLQFRYFLLIGLIHILLLVLSFELLNEQKRYFILGEVGILLSFLASIALYRSFIRPLRFLSSGVDAIEDKDFAVKFVPTGAREMDQLISTYNTMIDQIREERKAIEEQQYFLQKIIQASPSGILIFDFDGLLTEFNPKAQALFQLKTELLQNKNEQAKHPYLNQLAAMQVGSTELIMAEGAKRYRCECSTFVHKGFTRKFIMVQEVSKELLEAEKRAYGKVIRMMAHEVNNSIGAINSILHSIQGFEELEQDWGQEIIEVLQISIERNEGLSQFMKKFADVIRLPKPNIERQSLSKICLETAKLMQTQAKTKNIEIEVIRPIEEVFDYFDLHQMEQVLVNIINLKKLKSS